MATYSLSLTAVAAGYTSVGETFTLPDSTVGGGATLVTGQLGGMYQAMSDNLPLLCKGPDGGFAYYTLDAERSTATTPVLKKM